MHYPNIEVMLQLTCTLPVTSCGCERISSTIPRLHTYMRTSMTQERLSSLALLHLHYDVPIDLDKAVDTSHEYSQNVTPLYTVFV